MRKGWVRVITSCGQWLLTDETVRRYGLTPGTALSRDKLEGLAQEVQLPAAKKDTGRYLERSEHSKSQLRGYLLRRGYSSLVAEAVIGWAEEVGYVDDARFALTYVRSHRERSPMGTRRLRAELTSKGVSEEVADRVLQPVDDRELIDVLVKKVRGSYGYLDPAKGRNRALSYLKRRGFDYSLSSEVVSLALPPEDAETRP